MRAEMVEIMMCPDEHRARARRVRAWAMAHGRPVDVAALGVILWVKHDCGAEPFDCWTLDGLAEFIWADVVGWCARNGVRRPARVAETLWSYLAYLADSGELAATSDDIDLLHRSLVAYGGLSGTGRARTKARPTGRRRQRETAALAPIVPIRAAMTTNAILGA